MVRKLNYGKDAAMSQPQFQSQPATDRITRQTSLKPSDVRKSLKKGKAAARKGDWPVAAKHLLVAWDAMPDDLSILTTLAHALTQLGVRDKAIAVIERALSVHSPTADLCIIIQSLAFGMEIFDVAEKIGQQLIAMQPTSAEHYINYATALAAQEKFDDAISILQEVLPIFATDAGLWNVLGTTVRSRDGVDAADIFFEEALKLDPNDFKTLSNFGQSKVMQLKFDEALALDLRSIAANPSSPEPRVGASVLQFMKGELAEAYTNYDFRFDMGRKVSQTQHYTHGLPIWQGDDLTGKTILIAAEQGIGDEVMFASFLHFIAEKAAKIVIGCDPRLVTIFQRAYPDAIVDGHDDRIRDGYRYRIFPAIEKQMAEGSLKVDCYLPCASTPKYFCKTGQDIITPKAATFTSAPKLSSAMKERLNAISDKPKIGLAWRSGLMDPNRRYLYNSFESMDAIWALAPQVDFINLQYGDCREEIADLKETKGIDLHQIDGIDLRQDIEGNLAIMQNCDMVISSCSAPGMFAAVSGCPTIFMSWGMPWWTFGHNGKIPWAMQAEAVLADYNTPWNEASLEAATMTKQQLGLA